MIKKLSIILTLLLPAFQVEQSVFQAYTQKIPGTQVTFDMAPIPGGSFTMGSNSSKNQDEQPEHAVKLDPFWMGTHEVTWDAFELFLDKNYELAISEGPIGEIVDGLTRPSIPYLDMTFGMGKEDKPAIGMTQYGAIQYCHWLYLKTGIFYRLPTEAEWEYAARAGSESRFFFGENEAELVEYAWTKENSPESTQKVGQKKPNPWGLYDIYGNVLEWTSDQYDPTFYQDSPGQNPSNPSLKLYPRVVRGGSFKHGADEISSSKRFVSDPKWKQIDPQIPKSQWWFPEAPFLGLRLVRPLNPPSPEEIKAYYTASPIDDY
ncbi:SUMF1/EgtB/PvdO family nonheme iron enzyme [Algoriphagus sp. CAU 1675]|uniref:formylglycine-generating enzyme family protein n=1 Tax=Algoriphagus sp. CAU 1675 TaxID=3032597 RepID=UPI0023DB309B|nr:SUMF1/EgtB/PvdO family nonheme iron enzyme [Algoriphagus sp. CAU 1675]MDF2156652.1 SUMF1/EgtB/PvdO family nonheme iron enzyme [Algoriphagus sp. CAU 1675]